MNTVRQRDIYAYLNLIPVPVPDSEHYEGPDHPPQDRPSWRSEETGFEVSVWYPGEIQLSQWTGDWWEPMEPIGTEAARSLAYAILAACLRAEVGAT